MLCKCSIKFIQTEIYVAWIFSMYFIVKLIFHSPLKAHETTRIGRFTSIVHPCFKDLSIIVYNRLYFEWAYFSNEIRRRTSLRYELFMSSRSRIVTNSLAEWLIRNEGSDTLFISSLSEPRQLMNGRNDASSYDFGLFHDHPSF